MATNAAPLRPAILRSLAGVMNATKADPNVAQRAEQLLAEGNLFDAHGVHSSFRGTLETLSSQADEKCKEATIAAKLALTITYMRDKTQTRATDSTVALIEADYALIENVVYEALSSPLFEDKNTGRSHQGFLSVPLCRLDKPNGDNDELWRLHVWLPSSLKLDHKFATHSHQSFGQSWIFAGEAENTLAHAKSTNDPTLATHAIYKLTQRYNKTLESNTIEQKEGAVVENTGRLLVVSESSRELYRRNESYVVPSDLFHTTEIRRGTTLATVFFFDSSRGFIKDAGVGLGPVDGTEFRQYRNPEGIPPKALVKVVRAVRAWETLIERALSSAQNGKWKDAMDTAGEAARSWDPYLERGTKKQIETPHDYHGLDRYKEVAQDLLLWSKYMAKGEEHLQRDNASEALSMFETAKESCRPMADFYMVSQCWRMTCMRLEWSQKYGQLWTENATVSGKQVSKTAE